jgi:hypothetical protein
MGLAMTVSFSELKPCLSCDQQPEADTQSDTGNTGFACNDFSHREALEREASARPSSASDYSNDDVVRARKHHFPRLRTLRDLELAGLALGRGLCV